MDFKSLTFRKAKLLGNWSALLTRDISNLQGFDEVRMVKAAIDTSCNVSISVSFRSQKSYSKAIRSSSMALDCQSHFVYGLTGDLHQYTIYHARQRSLNSTKGLEEDVHLLQFADTIVAGGVEGVKETGGPDITAYVRFGRRDTDDRDDPNRVSDPRHRSTSRNAPGRCMKESRGVSELSYVRTDSIRSSAPNELW